MSRYAIWNKTDAILTPVGEVFTAEQWIARYPIASMDNIKVVCGGGEINGAFFGTLGSMVEMYTKRGCDFSGCETDQDKLDAIEAFDDASNAPDDSYISTDERIAAALEAQVMMSMPDEDTEVV